ncbi:MAG: hypothetical protein IPN76_32190 [Saprospiraceae bacterium]|nr:hypothetical protein [Saprospiraceae bacterium]
MSSHYPTLSVIDFEKSGGVLRRAATAAAASRWLDGLFQAIQPLPKLMYV